MKRMKSLSDGSMMDTETGVLYDNEDYVFMAFPRRLKLNEDWFMAFQDAREILAKDKDIWGQPRAVLDYLEARLSFENFIAIENTEVAKALDIGKNRVSEALKKLSDKCIIERGPKIGRTWSFKLNPFYAWKGNVKNLQEARKKHLKIIF